MPKRADLIPPVYRPSILVTHVAISIAKLFDCGYACAVISAADDIVFPKLLLLTFVRLSRIMHRKQHKEEMKVRYLLKNAKFFSQGVFHLADVFLSDGKIVSRCKLLSTMIIVASSSVRLRTMQGISVMPANVAAHFRL